jgi:competence protein ComGF
MIFFEKQTRLEASGVKKVSALVHVYALIVYITLLSDTDISFGLFNLFTYFDTPFW